ncbi:thioether cross-link-forming SCIFF peptide maturase [Clostridia bacterium]|nr:thioether cross-link-forming SCIFF peptide maturase [Clostridia bacterium]
MVHIFKQLGQRIAVDVGSGAVHVLSPQAYELLDFTIANNLEMTKAPPKLQTVYPPESIHEAWNALYALYKSGELFARDGGASLTLPTDTPLKALCLHVAHDCNLRCEYCFAETGGFGGARGIMDTSTAIAAIDYLVSRSGKRRNLEVDFFGGEPLMAFETVKNTVKYARGLEKAHGKNFRFTITTNGVLLDNESIAFINAEMSNVVLSLDGRRAIHDELRPTINGRGSYDIIVPKYRALLAERRTDWFVRGTFTAKNPAFVDNLLHIADLGFPNISIEPVVLPDGHKLALRDEQLPIIEGEYERLAAIMAERDDFTFFHFAVDLNQGPCIYKRLRGCGAGFEYAAVTPDGGVYPCHQFAEKPEYLMGNVKTGGFDPEISRKFASAHVQTRQKCSQCWAKYYCSGGCSAANLNTNGDIDATYEMGCRLEKKRLECAIALQAVRSA